MVISKEDLRQGSRILTADGKIAIFEILGSFPFGIEVIREGEDDPENVYWKDDIFLSERGLPVKEFNNDEAFVFKINAEKKVGDAI